MKDTLTDKGYYQLEELMKRCATAEDFRTLSYELYCFDPERFAYLGPHMPDSAEITFWDIYELFKPLFQEERLEGRTTH